MSSARLTTIEFDDYHPQHFDWDLKDRIGTVTLNRPEKKNPLTFDSYAELRDLFRNLCYADGVDGVVITGAGGNFCSGGDVHEIIGPLVEMEMKELMAFTRMTGDLIKAIRACPQIVVSAIDGICAGAGAAIAMSSDLRYGTEEAKVAFLFVRVGLAGCDMGACAMLPRLVGQGRACELLLSGRAMSGSDGERWGFYNDLFSSDELQESVRSRLARLVAGPTFAHGMTKTMLNQEWNMTLDQAIEAEAQAQAICMQTADFGRAYRAFAAKEKPVFEGN